MSSYHKWENLYRLKCWKLLVLLTLSGLCSFPYTTDITLKSSFFQSKFCFLQIFFTRTVSSLLFLFSPKLKLYFSPLISLWLQYIALRKLIRKGHLCDLQNWILRIHQGFPGGSNSKEFACNAGDPWIDPWVGKIPWKGEWLPTPVFLPGEFPWTEEASGLQAVVSQRIGHDWATHSLSVGVRQVDADRAHGWQGLLWQVPLRIQPRKLGDDSAKVGNGEAIGECPTSDRGRSRGQSNLYSVVRVTLTL